MSVAEEPGVSPLRWPLYRAPVDAEHAQPVEAAEVRGAEPVKELRVHHTLTVVPLPLQERPPLVLSEVLDQAEVHSLHPAAQ